MNFEKFCEMIKSLDANMSIGIHGVKKLSLSQDNISNRIMNEGLELQGWGGILSSVIMFGKIKDLSSNDLRNLYNYAYGIGNKGEITNVLFGFPEIITNSQGKDFYLGYYSQKNINGYAKGQEKAGSDLPLNILFDMKHHIPNDFIIGCIKTNANNPNINFISNSSFYGFSNNQLFYDKLYKELADNQIVNPVEYHKNIELFKRFGIPGGLGVEQYEEYLLERKAKTF